MTRTGRGGFKKRLALLFGCALLLIVFAWVLMGRRQGAAERWMAEMRTKGEKFTLEELGLLRPASTNAAMEIIEVAASRFKALERAQLSTSFRSSEEVGSGRKRVVWAETNLHSVMARVLDWQTMAREIEALQPTLATLRQMLRNPPLDSGRDYTGTVRTVSLVAIREVAQSLHDAVMLDLHNKDLSSAQKDLAALIGMARLHAGSWTIVDQMIRSAITGLAADATWNALQASGWTEEQLANLQGQFEKVSFFEETEKTLRCERAFGLYWIQRLRDGRESPTTLFAAPSQRSWTDILSERVVHRLWRFFWVEDDTLTFVRHHQTVIDIIHEMSNQGAFSDVAPKLTAARDKLDDKLRSAFRYRYLFSALAVPNVNWAFENLVKNETLRQLTITAIALKRFELRHGKLPRELAELQPEFLTSLPTDYFDGKPVRYKLNRLFRSILCGTRLSR
jgi:hypothetical protein